MTTTPDGQIVCHGGNILPRGMTEALARRESEIDYTGVRLFRIVYMDGATEYVPSRTVPDIQPRVAVDSEGDVRQVPTVVTVNHPIQWAARVDDIRLVAEVVSVEQLEMLAIMDDIASDEGDDD